MKKLEFSDLKVGMRVKDVHENISIIKKCKDEHNILVKFEPYGGYGFYCLDPTDKKYYDPLYEIE